MSALLVLLIITETVIAQNTSVCVWGRDTTPNTAINGEFLYQGIFNGGPWYKKVYGTDTRYLFKGDTRYFISADEPQIDPSAHAHCATSTVYPHECDQWTVHSNSNGWEVDPDVFCEMGPCAEWDCDQIITNINYEGCNETFSVKMGANLWANMKQDIFFYFNYIGFNWICNQQVIYKDRGTIGTTFAYSEIKWIDNSIGNTVDIHFTTPFDQIQEIQCLQYPTSEPTQQPTVAPTYIPTLSPSSLPTMKPTLSPSQDPSKVPTFAPTRSPTYDPTILPTIGPTNVPSIAPSNSPTKSPLVISAISSTLHSNTVGPENSATEEGVNVLLYIAIIGASTFVCGGAIGYVLLVICIPKFNTQNRNKHAMNANHAKDELPQPQNKVKTPNNALIPAENTKKMGNIEMEVLHDADEVKQWLENIVHLAIYYDLFVDSGYGTLEHMELITNETHLIEIGIGVKAHRVQILKEIQQLRDEGRGHEGQIEPETYNAHNTIDGQQTEDDFIIVGDDEITRGNNTTLQ